MNKIKNKLFLLTVLSCVSFFAFGQGFEGEIKYDRNYYWVKVNSRMPYLSQEEKDRMKYTYGKREGWTSKMELWIQNNQTVYKDGEQSGSEGWSWRPEEFLIYRDFNTMHSKELIETLGKTYLIDESFHFPKWKIKNEIKEVAGYLCMKAETVDTIKNQTIEAWFTDQIQVNSGPERMCGLPGMIMELNLNDGCVVITATSVIPKKLENGLPLPKKFKGKKISDYDLQMKMKKQIADAIKSEKNPYWSIRY